MYSHQEDVSGFPFFSQLSKEQSFTSSFKKEKKSITHIWNPHLSQQSSNYCVFCHVEFFDLVEWHAHMGSFIHRAPSLTEEEAAKLHFEQLIFCKFCSQEIRVSTVNEHRCFLTEVSKLKELVAMYNSSYCPLICILCKKIKVFSSQAVLQIHIVTRHSPLKHPKRCSLCSAEFKTIDVNVHEVHAVDEHGPELNLLYYKLSENSNKKSKGDTIKYNCALYYYNSTLNKEALNSCENISDLFQLTIHTLCFHGYGQLKSFTEHTQKKHSSILSNYRNDIKITCKFCGLEVVNVQKLNEHIFESHTLELLLRRDFIIKKKLFIGKIPMNLTCFYCLTIFTSVSKLQVHLMVRHGSTEFGVCGMCDKDLMSFADKVNPNRLSKMHWRSIQYHEKCHYEQFNHFIVHGVFNQNLNPDPILYQSYKDFTDEQERQKNYKPDVLFSDDKIAFLKRLGKINYENQINMEMLAN